MTREQIEQEIRNLVSALSSDVSEIGDWKNLKQMDEQCYTEEEMTKYRKARSEVRKRINRLEEELNGVSE